MGLINWIFDIYQHTQIDKARDEAARARSEIEALRATGGGVDTGRLLVALEEMALATKTIQRALIDKGVCSREEFEALLRRIDVEDGKADGRAPL